MVTNLLQIPKKKLTTPVRVELTILRLTVARLNQLGHGVTVNSAVVQKNYHYARHFISYSLLLHIHNFFECVLSRVMFTTATWISPLQYAGQASAFIFKVTICSSNTFIVSITD